MSELHSRHLHFQEITNFRDLGGYRTRDGRSVAWRRVFRSGQLGRMSDKDFNRLTEELAIKTVIDLRDEMETERHGIGPLAEAGVTYHQVPFLAGGKNVAEDRAVFRTVSNMGEFYLHLIRRPGFGKQMLAALEIIADPDNHPVVFHCAVGKDRTGILAAVLLDVLGVDDNDIVTDYSLSGPYMVELLGHFSERPDPDKIVEQLPGFFWEAAPESIALLLLSLRRNYGSIEGYLEAQGADATLVVRLKEALLV